MKVEYRRIRFEREYSDICVYLLVNESVVNTLKAMDDDFTGVLYDRKHKTMHFQTLTEGELVVLVPDKKVGAVMEAFVNVMTGTVFNTVNVEWCEQ